MMYGQFNPYAQIMPQMASQSLVRVSGIDGAKAQPVGAGQTVALFDSNEDLFYLKSCDNSGFPSIRVFKFEEIKETSSKMEQVDYVSREEMEEYVKHIIQSINTAGADATSKSTASTND